VADDALTPTCFNLMTYPLEPKSQIIVSSVVHRRTVKKSAKK